MRVRTNSRRDDGLHEGKTIGFKAIEMHSTISASKHSFRAVNLVEKWIFVGIETPESDRERTG